MDEIDDFELDNLTAMRMALDLTGIIGVMDLAIGHLSGLWLALPCALAAVSIRFYQEKRSERRTIASTWILTRQEGANRHEREK